MLEGRVITNTLKEIKRNSNYPYKEQLLNCDLSGLKESNNSIYGIAIK